MHSPKDLENFWQSVLAICSYKEKLTCSVFWCQYWQVDPNRVGGRKKRFCEVCKSVNDTSLFKRRDIDKAFNILKRPFDCTSHHAIYLFEYKQCQYRCPNVGSTKTKFRYRIDNYKSINS